MARRRPLGQQRGGFVDPLRVDVGESDEPAMTREVPRRRAPAARSAAGPVLAHRGVDYCLIKKLELITGTGPGHRDGFGFVLRDDGGGLSFLSPAVKMRTGGGRVKEGQY